MNKRGKATGFVGHLHNKCYLITSQHVIQGRRDKPSDITITFKNCDPLKGNEMFISATGWFTDSKTNLKDNVSCNNL